MARAASEPGAMNPGFKSSLPGVSVVRGVGRTLGSGPARTADAREDGFTRLVRITNRAEYGPNAGIPFLGTFDSRLYPEGADPDNMETWLQPGETMTVERDAALFMCGDVVDPTKDEIDRVRQRYGGDQYADPGKVEKVARMTVVGEPPIPDLIVEMEARQGVTAKQYEVYKIFGQGITEAVKSTNRPQRG